MIFDFIPALYVTTERDRRVLSPSNSMALLISARIVLYLYGRSGHHFETKGSKIKAIFST